MKPWIGQFSWYGRWGAYQTYTAVVSALTESQALGLLLQAYPDTAADGWTLELVELEIEHVIHLQSSSH